MRYGVHYIDNSPGMHGRCAICDGIEPEEAFVNHCVAGTGQAPLHTDLADLQGVLCRVPEYTTVDDMGTTQGPFNYLSDGYANDDCLINSHDTQGKCLHVDNGGDRYERVY